MQSLSAFYLIVGLGNPGVAYQTTRHNVGFRVVEGLAQKHGLVFRKDRTIQGSVAEGVLGEHKVLLVLPQTYMNSSGESVRTCVSYYKIPLSQVLVVCDDVYLPLGDLRIKTRGGCGGHNGLKSIESHLGTTAYARLRVGVGDLGVNALADHVLSSFSLDEEQQLMSPLHRAVQALECWLLRGIVAATQLANGKAKETLEDKQNETHEEM